MKRLKLQNVLTRKQLTLREQVINDQTDVGALARLSIVVQQRPNGVVVDLILPQEVKEDVP